MDERVGSGMQQTKSSGACCTAGPPSGCGSAVAKSPYGQPQLPHSHQQQQQRVCSGCGRTIQDRYLLRALDSYWHEDCLKCSCCDCRLGEVGSTLYLKAELKLCKKDYLRLFGLPGNCSACSKSIPAFEMAMKAKEHFYHLDCFACQQCNHRFCVGDRYYLCGNRILCEMDYEDACSSIDLDPTIAEAAASASSFGMADGRADGLVRQMSYGALQPTATT